jgi:hypothetical protein
MPDIQHVNVKVFARTSSKIEWHDAITVFHRWIQDKLTDDTLVDVADYAHVPAGPGVMLVGHKAIVSLDMREKRLGLLYNHRAAVEGTTEEKIRQAFEAAVRACRRLEQEPEFAGKLSFDDHRCEVFINDRMLAPNTDETWQAVKPALQQVFASSDLKWNGPSRDLLRVSVNS